MGDVTRGCVVEIPSGAVFLAERGAGLVEAPAGAAVGERAARPDVLDLRLPRPAGAGADRGAGRADRRLVGRRRRPSTSARPRFDMTRVVTGQLDAYVEPGPRMVADVPGMREEFERVGGGAVLNNSPYDLAAAALILEEAGAVVTDAYGEPLGDRPLLGSGAEFQMSVVASANPALHERILERDRRWHRAATWVTCRAVDGPPTAATSRSRSRPSPSYLVLARLALSAVCRLTPLEPDGGGRPQARRHRGGQRLRRRRTPGDEEHGCDFYFRARGRPARARARGPGGQPRRRGAGARPGDHRGDRRRVRPSTQGRTGSSSTCAKPRTSLPRCCSRSRSATRAWPTTPTSSGKPLVEEIRELAERAQGPEGPAPVGHRVRRRRVGDPLHAGPADARRRASRPSGR